jgi:hypothetical protein
MSDQSAVSVDHEAGLSRSEMRVRAKHVTLHYIAATSDKWDGVVKQPHPGDSRVVRADVLDRLVEGCGGGGGQGVEGSRTLNSILNSSKPKSRSRSRLKSEHRLLKK